MTDEIKKEQELEEAKKAAQANRDADKADAPEEQIDGVSPDANQTKEPGSDHNRDADKKPAVEEGCDSGKKKMSEDDDEEEHDDEEEVKAKKSDDSDDDDDEEKEVDESLIQGILDSISESFVFEADQTELGNLLESEEFSDEFKQKAITVFEAAVTSTASKHIEAVLEAAENDIRSGLQARYEQLDEEVEVYLEHAVKNWQEENKVAIESSLRLENAESFMLGLKELLESHYVEMPEEKEDLLATAIEESEHLEAAISEQIEENIKLTDEIASLQKKLVFEQFTRTMTDVEVERMSDLSEGVVFESEDQFAGALETLKENFLGEKKKSEPSKPVDALVEDEEKEEVKDDTIVEETDDEVARLAAYISGK